MAIIIKSHKDTLLIDSTIGINYNSGNVLQGEKAMYERIVRDCEALRAAPVRRVNEHPGAAN